MAKFMDVHTGFIGVTAEQLDEAHGRDLAIEADEGVHFLNLAPEPERHLQGLEPEGHVPR